VFFDLKSFGMIFSYYPDNLANYIKQRKQKIEISEIRQLIAGLLKGVDYLHQNGVRIGPHI
jgi:serine/threonine protein kinase